MHQLFKIGDKVSIINQALSGIIVNIKDLNAEVEYEDGFSDWYSFHQLIIDKDIDLEAIEHEEKHQTSIIAIRNEKVEEIDLHIENIYFDWKRLPKEKILERQISHFHEEFYEARKNKMDKLIVIHGKGKGILKNAILEELNKYVNLAYQDMNYGKYKDAAIEIFFN